MDKFTETITVIKLLNKLRTTTTNSQRYSDNRQIATIIKKTRRKRKYVNVSHIPFMYPKQLILYEYQ